jgi:two-component system, chemotaxis family, protein-glutamate methylesterase/glutaminase
MGSRDVTVASDGKVRRGPATQVAVLVVDDSPLMQRIITRLLESDPQIRVMATASDGLEAVEKVAALHPDVVTLDIEMPRLDGLGALRQIMALTPTPVVMLSALGDAETVMAALQLGAVDFVTKPSGMVSIDLYKVGAELVQKVKVATFSRPTCAQPAPTRAEAQARGRRTQPAALAGAGAWCLAMGASTGGPGAISQLLSELPASFPGSVLVVQHMPVGFTQAFAERLDRDTALAVLEAEDGAEVAPGCVYVAPGGAHMLVARRGRGRSTEAPVIALTQTPEVNSVRPSIDVLMASVAEVYEGDAVGVLLSGMGRDGAAGLAEMKAAGAYTIVQDRETSTIFGMPRVAIGMGVVDEVLPLTQIAPRVLQVLHDRQDRIETDD